MVDRFGFRALALFVAAAAAIGVTVELLPTVQAREDADAARRKYDADAIAAREHLAAEVDAKFAPRANPGGQSEYLMANRGRRELS
jgi:hypothetical protein